MNFRALRYFLVVAHEKSITQAAARLHLSQSTLSKSVQSLEAELGVQLLLRTNRNVALTAEGLFLRRRAEELLALMEKTEAEFGRMEDAREVIDIGSGETPLLRFVTDQIAAFRADCPHVMFRLHSYTADDICTQLDQGLLDFGVLIKPVEVHRYASLSLPGATAWGALMPRDHPLAAKQAVAPRELAAYPLILPNRVENSAALRQWFGLPADQLNVRAVYNLLFNAALLCEAGMGIVLTREQLADDMAVRGLRFCPLSPPLTSQLLLVWRRDRPLSRMGEKFLRQLQNAEDHE